MSTRKLRAGERSNCRADWPKGRKRCEDCYALTAMTSALLGLALLASAPPDFVAQQLSFRAIRAVEAWGYVQSTSGGAVVAVLDSGIDGEHPELVPNLWANPGEIPGNGVDDDANGKIDDVRGWDFLDGDADPSDPLGRGTHVAGVIGAKGDNGIGVAGIAWNVRLMAVRVMETNLFRTRIAGAAAAEAIRYAADEGADVILVDFQVDADDPGLQALLDAVRHAVASDAVVVAAAGDDSNDLDREPLYPAAWDEPGLISVGSVDMGAKVALSSNFGKTTVALVAPGVNVFSTLPGGFLGVQSGTAQSAAHVAGAVALFRALKPAVGAVEIATDVPRLSSNRDILAEKCRSGSILDLGLLIAEKRDTVDARIVAPKRVKVGEEVVFDGRLSEGPIVEYLWKFGDPIDEFGPVVPRRWHRPGKVGVELIVRTFDGRTASIATEITVDGNDELTRMGCDAGGVSPVTSAPGLLALVAAAALAFQLLRRSIRRR